MSQDASGLCQALTAFPSSDILLGLPKFKFLRDWLEQDLHVAGLPATSDLWPISDNWLAEFEKLVEKCRTDDQHMYLPELQHLREFAIRRFGATLPHKQNQNWKLDNLPVELLCQVAEYLNVRDLGALRATCKRFYECTRDMVRHILRHPDWITKVRPEALNATQRPMGLWSGKLQLLQRAIFDVSIQKFFTVNSQFFGAWRGTVDYIYVYFFTYDTLEFYGPLQLEHSPGDVLCFGSSRNLLILHVVPEHRIVCYQLSTDMVRVMDTTFVCFANVSHAAFAVGDGTLYLAEAECIVVMDACNWTVMEKIETSEKTRAMAVTKKCLVVAGRKNVLCVNLADNTVQKFYQPDIWAIAISPDSNLIAINSANRKMSVWMRESLVCVLEKHTMMDFDDCFFFGHYCKMPCLFCWCKVTGYLYCYQVPDFGFLWKKKLGCFVCVLANAYNVVWNQLYIDSSLSTTFCRLKL